MRVLLVTCEGDLCEVDLVDLVPGWVGDMEHLVDHVSQIHSYSSLIWGEAEGLGVKSIYDVLQSDRELVMVDREHHILEGGRGLDSCNR